MVPEAFVRGIRDLGYRSNGDALAELVDNALQADAERIDILFGFEGTTSGKKPSQLAVVDNGHGMEPDMIRMAVMWGGTHRENDRTGLGRYGYGLPCSSVSLGRSFTVFSRAVDSELWAVELDLDEITAGRYTNSKGEIVVPEPHRAELPHFVRDHLARTGQSERNSGTVILIEKLDRLEWTTSQGLRSNFCRQFGVTYHKLRGDAAIYVDGEFVEPIDPLFLTPEFRWFELDDDRAQPFDPVRVEVRDPESGVFLGAINVRYAWFPPSFGSVDKDRDAVGVNANARFSVLKDYHGIIFYRNGRLIDVQTRTPWTTFINNDRYIKVDVDFSATLDEEFGVTTSKQQVTVTPLVWDLLREAGLAKAIEQLRSKVKEAKALRQLRQLSPPPGKPRLSEKTMTSARGVGPTGASRLQWDLGLRASPYKVVFEHSPGRPFFRVDRSGGARTLHINTSHRFFEQIYQAPCITAELQTALEILLFTLGDVALENMPSGDNGGNMQFVSWSKRLDLALAMLVEHMDRGEDMDVGLQE